VMGRVLGFDPRTRALEVSFDQPIPFLSVSGTELFYAGSAVFTPKASVRAAYALCGVAGTLRPDNMATSGISAIIVTYPCSSTDSSAAVSRCE